MKSTLVIVVALAPWIAGCANTAPEWEGSFGDASRQLRAGQVIDPAASSRNTGPGLTDGKAAAGAQKSYSESFGYAVKETAQPALTISTTGK
jgi:hypothetical protein